MSMSFHKKKKNRSSTGVLLFIFRLIAFFFTQCTATHLAACTWILREISMADLTSYQGNHASLLVAAHLFRIPPAPSPQKRKKVVNTALPVSTALQRFVYRNWAAPPLVDSHSSPSSHRRRGTGVAWLIIINFYHFLTQQPLLESRPLDWSGAVSGCHRDERKRSLKAMKEISKYQKKRGAVQRHCSSSSSSSSGT